MINLPSSSVSQSVEQALQRAEGTLPDAAPLSPQVADAVRKLAAQARGKGRLDKVAESVGFCKFHLIHKFRREVGLTPGAFLQQCRIHRAMELLRGTEMNIGAVGRESGYLSGAAFARAFQQVTGTTPTQYRTRGRRKR